MASSDCWRWANKKLCKTNMRRQIAILTILFFISSCSSKTETSKSELTDSTKNQVKADSEKAELSIQENLPDFVKATKLPDNLIIDVGNVITGDFNADGEDDFASLVTNQKNKFKGV